MVGNTAFDKNKLSSSLNAALFFASDDAVREILKYGKLLRSQGPAPHVVTNKEIQPLVKAIRKDLYLKSKSIDEEGLSFF